MKLSYFSENKILLFEDIEIIIVYLMILKNLQKNNKNFKKLLIFRILSDDEALKQFFKQEQLI